MSIKLIIVFVIIYLFKTTRYALYSDHHITISIYIWDAFNWMDILPNILGGNWGAGGQGLISICVDKVLKSGPGPQPPSQGSTKLFSSIISIKNSSNLPWKSVIFIPPNSQEIEWNLLLQKLLSVTETFFSHRNFFLSQKLFSVTETTFCDRNYFLWQKLFSMTESLFFYNIFLLSLLSVT